MHEVGRKGLLSTKSALHELSLFLILMLRLCSVNETAREQERSLSEQGSMKGDREGEGDGEDDEEGRKEGDSDERDNADEDEAKVDPVELDAKQLVRLEERADEESRGCAGEGLER